MRCGASRGLHGRQRTLDQRAWWGIWPRRSCDQSEVEMNVSSAPEEVRSRVWVQTWIWRHALRKLGQLETVSLGRYSGIQVF